MKEIIAIGNDHAGVELKLELIKTIEELGFDYKDFGCNRNEKADYPVYAQKVCDAVISTECKYGILVCGTGVGMCIAANKVQAIRAVVASEPFSAKLSKMHNNTNVLTLGARVVGTELAKMILTEWLNAEFDGDRHQDRVNLITKIENKEKLY